jgi:predicted CopG family antitoxin
MKERLLKIFTGKTKYQRAKKEWFNKRVYKFYIREDGYEPNSISYKKDRYRKLTYYGGRQSVSQFLELLYSKPNHESFFLAKYESMLKEPKISFSYELVVDYEQKIFYELTPQERRDSSIDKILQ